MGRFYRAAPALYAAVCAPHAWHWRILGAGPTGTDAMRKPATPALPPAFRLAVPLLLAMLLGACATGGAGLPGTQAAGDVPAIPDDAVAAVRTEDNGDVVTEYRVQGQLRVVKVVPFRGPAYYLVDRDGDGHMDPAKGEVPTTWFKLFSW
jgi:hypothetical protein